MKYKSIARGRFIARPNRFIAYVEIDGATEVCHVKNTGRCKELLIEGAEVILEVSDNPKRKTKYDIIAVYKGNVLINMDSQAPNRVAAEWLRGGGYFEGPTLVKPECTYGGSRFDFYLEAGERRAFVEVKGVTLEENGVAMFPDAPTERGVKHLKELMAAKEEGYEACALFVIQMKGCSRFVPNRATHPEFAKALALVKNSGVDVLAVDCKVGEDSLIIDRAVPVDIEG